MYVTKVGWSVLTNVTNAKLGMYVATEMITKVSH